MIPASVYGLKMRDNFPPVLVVVNLLNFLSDFFVFSAPCAFCENWLEIFLTEVGIQPLFSWHILGAAEYSLRINDNEEPTILL